MQQKIKSRPLRGYSLGAVNNAYNGYQRLTLRKLSEAFCHLSLLSNESWHARFALMAVEPITQD